MRKEIYLVLSSLLLITAPSFAAVDATAHIKDGESFAVAGEWGQACNQFYLATEADPKNVIGFYDLGVAHYHLGNFDRALEAERNALKLNDKYVDAYVQIAAILMKTGDVAGAEVSLRKALTLDHTNKKAQDGMSELQRLKQEQELKSPSPKPGDKPMAVQEASSVTEATVYYAAGDLERANETLQSVIKDNPDDAFAHANLGVVMGAQNDFQGEVTEEKKTISIEPSNAIAWLNLAWAQSRLNLWEEALVAYNKVLALDPNIGSAAAGAARCEAHLGHVEQMKVQLRNRIATSSAKETWPYLALGAVLADEGALNDAAQIYAKALSLNPKNTEAMLQLADVLMKQQKWEEAAKQLRLVIEIMPQSMESQLNYAKVQLHLGNNESALHYLKASCEMAPHNAVAHSELATLLLKLGEKDESEAESKRAADLRMTSK